MTSFIADPQDPTRSNTQAYFNMLNWISALPPRDYENVSLMSDSKKPDNSSDDNVLDEKNGKEETEGTFATIYRVNSKSELFVTVENPSGVVIKDEFEFRKSESIGNAEGKILDIHHVLYFFFFFRLVHNFDAIRCIRHFFAF
jgi:hypothetical protein